MTVTAGMHDGLQELICGSSGVFYGTKEQWAIGLKGLSFSVYQLCNKWSTGCPSGESPYMAVDPFVWRVIVAATYLLTKILNLYSKEVLCFIPVKL